MFYPEFLKKNDVIGICAPSAGVGSHLAEFDKSLLTLRSEGYKIVETASVRTNGVRAADAKTRGEELNSLFRNSDVQMVMAATGGDFLQEMLPFVDWELLKEKPKWLCGASDPTSLLFTLTTKYDIATLYGVNAGAFENPEDSYTQAALDFIQGDLVPEYSSKMHSKYADFLPEYSGCDTKTVWKSSTDEISVTGRCIGGCIDVLKDLIGTKYDSAQTFVDKYKDDGFIWYFDNFSMDADIFYRTLIQMRYAGWLDHTKAVLIGRVLFPTEGEAISYEEALRRALPDIPYIYEMDIGHTVPAFTLVNGAMMHAEVNKGQGHVSFELK